MTSNELNNTKNNVNKCCCQSYNCDSNFVNTYPLISVLIASGIVLSATTLISPKARKVMLPAFKYLGKQQLKLFAGIGILSLATYVASDNLDLNEEFEIEKYENKDEIILNNILK